ncbi:MAG TPA: thioesterase family protein [Hanamia sp.]|nr:thioesterase family protein [Hanamia sp.]
MARIKIELPAESIASFNIPVRITDINYGNHVGNNSIVEIIHEARFQFLQQYQFTEMDAGGTGLILNELIVEFKNESFYGDIVNVKIFAGEISKKSFEIYYQLIALRSENIVIAHAKTGVVCYNYSERKVESIPEKLKSILTH